MIRLGLRLAVAGGRTAVTRLVIIAAAVALGVGLLLATLAGTNAVEAQNQRHAWLNTSAESAPDPDATDPLWWLFRDDYLDRNTIARVDVAATGPDAPVPPGISRLPGPGEFFASPSMSALLDSTPADQLADRYPGREVGTIGRAALTDPESLVIIVGHEPGELSSMPRAEQVTGIETTVPPARAAALDLILSVVGAGLLFPVLIFIGTATRLTAARREQRFAAMRLVGATPRQVGTVAAVESAVASLAGTAIGFALFPLFRPPLAKIPFTGAPFFLDDLSLGPVDVLLVALGVPALAAVAALIALRRVRISPLGVARRTTPRAPRAYRLIPLLLGIGELAYFIGRRPETSQGQVMAFLPGFLLVMVGLMVAGPWLTMVGARVMARRSRRPATLIAARRLADNPRAGFRAVSGLVLALFVTSVAVGTITTVVDNNGIHGTGTAARNALFTPFFPDVEQDADATFPAPLAAELRAVPGVRGTVAVHEHPDGAAAEVPGLVRCADLARAPEFPQCEPGAEVAGVWPGLTEPERAPGSPDAWPAAEFTVDETEQLALLSVVVDTDGSTTAIERARTVLETAYPERPILPATEVDFQAQATETLDGYQQLANVVIVTSLVIAGCSLAASVAGGLSDRKIPFSLLRLSGAPLRVLRRAVALESAVPLLAAAVVAIGAGFASAGLFLEAQMDYPLRAPGADYYVIVLAGLAASLAIIVATFPLLKRVTGPETARNE